MWCVFSGAEENMLSTIPTEAASAAAVTAAPAVTAAAMDAEQHMGSPMFDMVLSFNSADYIMFIVMMLLSAFIGVYYGCIKKQDSVSEYLHGGKNMSIFPIAMSLISRCGTVLVFA